MMVKIKEIKEENEDDEYVKSSNKSSTPLLLPRLANGRTSLCLLWCCCFLVIAFLFFFNLTRTLCNVNFSRRTKSKKKMVLREMCVFFLSVHRCGWDIDKKKKKKITHVHLLLPARTTFPTL